LRMRKKTKRKISSICILLTVYELPFLILLPSRN
jgi:hypothetical protein